MHNVIELAEHSYSRQNWPRCIFFFFFKVKGKEWGSPNNLFWQDVEGGKIHRLFDLGTGVRFLTCGGLYRRQRYLRCGDFYLNDSDSFLVQPWHFLPGDDSQWQTSPQPTTGCPFTWGVGASLPRPARQGAGQAVAPEAPSLESVLRSC